MDKPIDESSLPKGLKVKLKSLGFMTIGNVLNNTKSLLSNIDSRTTRQIHSILTKDLESVHNNIQLINPILHPSTHHVSQPITHELNHKSTFSCPQPNDHTLGANTIFQSITVTDIPNAYHSTTNFQPISTFTSSFDPIPLRLPLGIEEFDRVYGGIPYGQLTEISGIPGMFASTHHVLGHFHQLLILFVDGYPLIMLLFLFSILP